jgi:hypothetical protein
MTRSLVLALLALLVAPVAQARTRAYVVVIANNRSLDPGVPALRYADDDGARTFELMSMYADRAALFAVLDDETARLHPEAAKQAEVPEKKLILQRLDQFNREMELDIARGDEPELFFIYAGHGDVAPDGQGYLNLQDEKLERRELYRTIVGPSKARFVHVIIDACKSYFMVKSRGKGAWQDDRVPAAEDKSGAAVEAFLAEEELDRHPRAGVIVATSGAAETHEWSRYRAGILSHELRSALTGAADVNSDGRIEYSEVRAFIASANARIKNPEARLEVFARAPAIDRHRPLVDLRRAASTERGARFLRFPASLTGRFHIEDERGVRWADFHKDASIAFDVIAPANRTLHVRRDDLLETELAAGGPRAIDLARRTWRSTAIAARGALDESFRVDLYRQPYGRGFYEGYVSTSGDESVADGPSFEATALAELKPIERHRLSAAYLMSGPPLANTSISHGAELRYDAHVVGPLVLGADVQVGHSAGNDASGFTSSLTRAALGGHIGAEWMPREFVALRLELGLYWQLLSGRVRIASVAVDGTELRGLRFEAAGGVAFRLARRLWLQARGGMALDSVFPASAPNSTGITGFFAIGPSIHF